jgi:hypothetical protein
MPGMWSPLSAKLVLPDVWSLTVIALVPLPTPLIVSRSRTPEPDSKLMLLSPSKTL